MSTERMMYHPNFYLTVNYTEYMGDIIMDTTKTINEAVVCRINQLLNGPIQTQYALAEVSGIPYPTIKSIMQRHTKGITLKTIIMLAHGFQMSVSEFLSDEYFNYELLDIES